MYTFIEIALSVGVLVTLITALTVCVCGCKNSNQNRSELVGTAGVVKIRFDEEVPSLTPTTPASIKRASTQNSQRSLPEIPHPVGRHDSGDTASEIYATVNLDEGNENVEVPSTSREHRYEHAYAKLQNETHNVAVGIEPDKVSEIEIQIDEREASQPGPEAVVISASVAISGQLPSSQELPYITPPSPRPHTENNVHFSGDSTDSTKGYTSISVREPLSNIRAQSAGAGGAAAAAAGAGAGRTARQAHYATVSDDSDEMYAAIEDASVGEGSDTYAQIAPEPRRRQTPPAAAHPAHHALADAPSAPSSRRSAPPEVGASTSRATHSRQASTSSCSNSTGALGSPKPEKRQANSPLPPPPPPPAHVAPPAHSAHSAHAGAPPPPPPLHAAGASSRAVADALRHQRILSTGDLQFNHDKLRRSFNEKHQRNNSCVSSSDFYGCNYPVEKHRFSSGELGRPLVARELDFDIDQRQRPTDNLYNSIDGADLEPAGADRRVTDSPSRNVDDMYAKVMKKGKHCTDETANNAIAIDPNDGPTIYRNDDPGYETIDRKKSNHGYETIARKQRTDSHSQDPTYETVKEVGKSGGDANFTNTLVDKLNHVAAGSDPGYEHIAKNGSDSEPNYEVLRNQPPTPPYATIAPNYKPQPAYSTVNKRPGKYGDWATNNNEHPTAEPNYESMPHDPLYTTGSESDPNYESVRPKDPNYESVHNYDSFRSKDPKYESLISKDPKYDSVRSRKDPNYESVKYFEVSRSEPPYEKVKSVDRSDSLAGYEKIKVPDENQAKASVNGAENTVVSDYFHV